MAVVVTPCAMATAPPRTHGDDAAMRGGDTPLDRLFATAEAQPSVPPFFPSLRVPRTTGGVLVWLLLLPLAPALYCVWVLFTASPLAVARLSADCFCCCAISRSGGRVRRRLSSPAACTAYAHTIVAGLIILTAGLCVLFDGMTFSSSANFAAAASVLILGGACHGVAVLHAMCGPGGDSFDSNAGDPCGLPPRRFVDTAPRPVAAAAAAVTNAAALDWSIAAVTVAVLEDPGAQQMDPPPPQQRGEDEVGPVGAAPAAVDSHAATTVVASSSPMRAPTVVEVPPRPPSTSELQDDPGVAADDQTR